MGVAPVETKPVDKVALGMDGSAPASVAAASTFTFPEEAERLAEVDRPTVENFCVNV